MSSNGIRWVEMRDTLKMKLRVARATMEKEEVKLEDL